MLSRDSGNAMLRKGALFGLFARVPRSHGITHNVCVLLPLTGHNRLPVCSQIYDFEWGPSHFTLLQPPLTAADVETGHLCITCTFALLHFWISFNPLKLQLMCKLVSADTRIDCRAMESLDYFCKLSKSLDTFVQIHQIYLDIDDFQQCSKF